MVTVKLQSQVSGYCSPSFSCLFACPALCPLPPPPFTYLSDFKSRPELLSIAFPSFLHGSRVRHGVRLRITAPHLTTVTGCQKKGSKSSPNFSLPSLHTVTVHSLVTHNTGPGRYLPNKNSARGLSICTFMLFLHEAVKHQRSESTVMRSVLFCTPRAVFVYPSCIYLLLRREREREREREAGREGGERERERDTHTHTHTHTDTDTERGRDRDRDKVYSQCSHVPRPTLPERMTFYLVLDLSPCVEATALSSLPAGDLACAAACLSF